MACHTIHYDTTALHGSEAGPLLGVCRIMMPSGLRRSDRTKAASNKEKKEREEGAVRDNDAEDAVEDSDGPGSNPGRAQHRELKAG